MKAQKLPENIEKDLNKNTMFNMFGLVNLAALRARTGTELSNEELKESINNRFGHEMSNGKVEFIEKHIVD